MERSWWRKAVLIGTVTLLACLAILPTVAPGGKPAFLQRHYSRRIQKGLDLQGGLRLVYAVDASADRAEDMDSMTATMEIIRRRVDQLGLSEPNIMRRDRDIVVELPGVRPQEFERIKLVVGSTAQLELKLVDDEADDYMKEVIARLPPQGPVRWLRDPWADRDSGAPHDLLCLEAGARQDLERFLATLGDLPPPADRTWGFEELVRADEDQAPHQVWRSYLLHRRAALTGAYLVDAEETWDQTGRPLVAFTMDRRGTELMERLTGENVGRRMAIVLDGRIASAPRIDEKIGRHGSIVVGGALDPSVLRQQVKDLVTVLRCGALPTPLRRTVETQVGPTLGEDAVARAELAMAVGAAAVVLFMLVYYRLAGLIATVAMLLNLLYMLAILATLEAALTLPGVAGLVLTVGMAVDANIIIYERIREELRLGKSPRPAVHAGFSRAFRTVFDAHLTNFVAGIVLFSLGSGPLRGFALTLLIGIATNLVTSVWISRWLLDLLVSRRSGQPATLSI